MSDAGDHHSHGGGGGGGGVGSDAGKEVGGPTDPANWTGRRARRWRNKERHKQRKRAEAAREKGGGAAAGLPFDSQRGSSGSEYTDSDHASAATLARSASGSARSLVGLPLHVGGKAAGIVPVSAGDEAGRAGAANGWAPPGAGGAGGATGNPLMDLAMQMGSEMHMTQLAMMGDPNALAALLAFQQQAAAANAAAAAAAASSGASREAMHLRASSTSASVGSSTAAVSTLSTSGSTAARRVSSSRPSAASLASSAAPARSTPSASAAACSRPHSAHAPLLCRSSRAATHPVHPACPHGWNSSWCTPGCSAAIERVALSRPSVSSSDGGKLDPLPPPEAAAPPVALLLAAVLPVRGEGVARSEMERFGVVHCAASMSAAAPVLPRRSSVLQTLVTMWMLCVDSSRKSSARVVLLSCTHTKSRQKLFA
eukprot:Rhum_TRINITY_DN15106_c6_g2::Rhum_TRINITY_DN15106_c6_g2_i1::g.139769::m.139769